MAISRFDAIKITGGTAGALDDIIHTNIADGDAAVVTDAVNNIKYNYTYDSSNSTAESDPTIINPDSNSGDGRWLLTAIRGMTLQCENGTAINEFSIDGTLAGNSDDAVPTEKAVKIYVDIQRQYVKVSEVQTSGTDGGGFTKDVWQTRVLNTEDSDDGTICSLVANQITLSAGDYECRISAPATKVTEHKIRLYNTTGAATLLTGTSEFIGDDGGDAATHNMNRSIVVGKFTIAAAQALEVQHYCASTRAVDGFGYACTFGVDEVYTIAEFWKVS